MSHNLSFDKEGKAEMFFTGQRPWHGLGQELNSPATSEEAITAAGMNWKVSKMDISLSGVDIKVPGKKAMVRLNEDGSPFKVFGVVGEGYVPFQNVEAFDFFDSVVGSSRAIYHTAGALDEGRRVWILAKFPDDIMVKGKDRVEKFTLLTMAHDGSGAISMMNTPIRVVCQNTLNIAVGSADEKVCIRHTKNARIKVQQAKAAIGIAEEAYKKFNEATMYLASVQFNTALLNAYFNNILPLRDSMTDITKNHVMEIRKNITEIFEKENDDIPEIGGTAWAAFNSVTQYSDHFKPVRKENSERRINSIWFGASSMMKQNAWNGIVSTAKTA